jgi:hypothetical protein
MWLTRNRRDLMPSLTPSQEFVFDQGEEVGKLAQQLYPGVLMQDRLRLLTISRL